MMTENPQGKYIVIEGHDGTGKSTQVRHLQKQLQNDGYDAIIVEEPGSDDPSLSTPVANALREIIKNGSLVRAPEVNLALFSAARRELLQQRIAPALARGAYVLSARNYYSTIAYQGYGEGLDVDLIDRTTRLFTSEQYMSPDLAVILTLNNETERTKRIDNRGQLENPDTFESKDEAFQRRVHEGYIHIADHYNVPTISANQSIEQVASAIRQLLNP